jgi:hypothetical protein
VAGGSADEFQKMISSEIRSWSEAAKAAGIVAK